MNKKNGWFIAAGVLSILSAVALFVCALIFFVIAPVFTNPEFMNSFEPALTTEEAEVFASMFRTLAVFMLIFTIPAIFDSVVFLKYSSKSYSELRQHSGLIITAIVFGFLCDGLLVGLFGVLGYTLKPEGEKNAEDVTISDAPSDTSTDTSSSDDVATRLEQLKNMKDSGLINEEEYNQKRKDILDNM